VQLEIWWKRYDQAAELIKNYISSSVELEMSKDPNNKAPEEK
jgi:hypothetical protein